MPFDKKKAAEDPKFEEFVEMFEFALETVEERRRKKAEEEAKKNPPKPKSIFSPFLGE